METIDAIVPSGNERTTLNFGFGRSTVQASLARKVY